MTATSWNRLLPLTDAARLAAETRLADWRRREQAIEAAISRLDESAAGGLNEDETLRRAGADVRWQTWCAAQRTALLTELAQVRYRRSMAEESMRHAAARAIAAEAVARDENAAALRQRAMRAEREGRS
jgi:predicted aminopeptidase